MQRKYQKGSFGRSALSIALAASMVLTYNPASAIAAEASAADFASTESTEIAKVATESVDYTVMTQKEIDAYEAAVEVQSEAESAAASAGQMSSMVLITTGTVECPNGWKLDYSITVGSGVTITNVNTAGEGSLTIPSTIEDEDVVAIGASAFKKCTALTSVTIPSTVKTIGDEAFRGAGLTSLTVPTGVTTLGKSAVRECASLTTCSLPNTLTAWGSYCFKGDTALVSINIPASLDRVPYSCFELCSSLKNVNFEGDSMRYIHRNAFENCTSLESITLPLLTEYPNVSESRAEGLISYTDFYYCIGMNAFFGDTNLELIVCKGPVVQDGKDYFAAAACLSGCASDLTVVFESASSEIGYGTTGRTFTLNRYDTLDFYNSMDDANNLTNRVASYTLKESTSANPIYLIGLVNGTKDYSDYRYETCTSTIPQAPEGKVWGVVDHPDASSSSAGMSSSSSFYNSGTKFTASYQVVAVDPEDMTYAWVESPSIRNFYEGISSSSTSSSSSYPTLYRNNDGIVEEAADFTVHAADDSVLEASAYDIEVDQAIIEYTVNVRGVTESTVAGWESRTIDDINEPGEYRIRAKGTGDYADTVTEYTYFYVSNPVPDTSSYYDADDSSLYLGTALTDATRLAYAENEAAPNYQVLVSSTDWRAQLLGAGFAGASPNNAVVLQNTGDDYSSKMTEAFVQSFSTRYLILGDQNAVPKSEVASEDGSYAYLADNISALATDGGYRFGGDAATAQELASSAIGEFNPSAWGVSWGSTAIVASSTKELATLTAAQFVEHNAARVYFLDETGALSSDDLAALKDTSIESIVVLGDAICVSDDVVSQIAAATGKNPTRKFDSASATSDSIAYAKELVAEKHAADPDGCLTVVVADATDSANVSAAASYAEAVDGVMLACRTKADARAIEKYFIEINAAYGNRYVKGMEIIGEFSYLGSTTDDVASFLQSAWNDGLSSYELCAGDTFEVDGYVYRLLNGKAAFVEATDGVDEDAAPSQVVYGGNTYAVSAASTYGITVEPTDVSAKMEDSVAFTVECNDDAAQYLWQMSSNGGKTWRTSGAFSNTSATYDIDTSYDTRDFLYRCVLTYSDGTTEASDTVRVNFENQIYTAPINVDGDVADLGEYVDYTTDAINAKSFQWQRSSDACATWVDDLLETDVSGSTVGTYITKDNCNDYYRCVVTFADGTTQTTNAVCVDWNNGIIYQPESIEDAQVGDAVAFSIGIPNDATCQWQQTSDEGATWESVEGATSSKFKFEVAREDGSKQYRCVVTYADGTSETSATCSVNVSAPSNKIVVQPKDYAAHCGETAYFSVTAVDAVSFQWQYSSDKASWHNSGSSGNKTSAFKTGVTLDNQARYYRCVVKFANGTTESSDACTVLQDSAILVQPTNINAKAGDQVSFSVEAENVQSYQWQFSGSGETWVNSGCTGCKNRTLKIKTTESNVERLYRCIITYRDGTQEITDIVTVIQPSELTKAPVDSVGSVGSTAIFSLKATNVASYQWEYSGNLTKWSASKNKGSSAATMSCTVTEANINRYYHCVITFKDGTSITTDPVKVVSGQITAQPENVIGKAGDTVYFTTASNDEYATYQWEYSSNGTKWYTSHNTGCTTTQLKVGVTTSNIARYYHCVITFNDGTTATTDAVRVVTS